MGRITSYRPLPDQAYDPRVTDLDNPLIPPAATGPGSLDNFRNRNVANTTPTQLVANVSTRILGANPRRTGLLIQNKDATASLFFAFGNAADITSVSVPPGGYALFDFTTPASELYLFSTANIQVSVLEMIRGY